MIFDRIVAAEDPTTLEAIRSQLSLDMASEVVGIIAAGLAIAVVGQLTGSDDRRRSAIMAVTPATVTPQCGPRY
jgi:hypothetical protein